MHFDSYYLGNVISNMHEFRRGRAHANGVHSVRNGRIESIFSEIKNRYFFVFYLGILMV